MNSVKVKIRILPPSVISRVHKLYRLSELTSSISWELRGRAAVVVFDGANMVTVREEMVQVIREELTS